MSRHRGGFGGQTPNSQVLGNKKSRILGMSSTTKLHLGILAIVFVSSFTLWVAKETLEGQRQEAIQFMTATAVYKECALYYRQLNAQLENQGLPSFVPPGELDEYCNNWATRTPGFDK